MNQRYCEMMKIRRTKGKICFLFFFFFQQIEDNDSKNLRNLEGI